MKKLLLSLLFVYSAVAGIDEIVVFKHERLMQLKEGGEVVKEYNIRLSIAHNNPLYRYQKKRLRGDNHTPEGSYKVSSKVDADWSRFPPSLLINYPNAEDIKWGKENGYTVSELGDAIQIHGEPKRPNPTLRKFVLKYFGWVFDTEKELDEALREYVYPYLDWTNGCVAISDVEMKEVYDLVKVGTPVKIYRYKPRTYNRRQRASN